jgi:hypothetical protein
LVGGVDRPPPKKQTQSNEQADRFRMSAVRDWSRGARGGGAGGNGVQGDIGTICDHRRGTRWVR